MNPGTIRLWRDELDQLLEYSTTLPTGFRDGKTWKRKHWGGSWWIGAYVLWHDVPRLVWFRPVLLSGPRRPNEKSRFTR